MVSEHRCRGDKEWWAVKERFLEEEIPICTLKDEKELFKSRIGCDGGDYLNRHQSRVSAMDNLHFAA